MTEAPLIAADLPPEFRALDVEARDFRPNSDPSPLGAQRWPLPLSSSLGW